MTCWGWCSHFIASSFMGLYVFLLQLWSELIFPPSIVLRVNSWRWQHVCDWNWWDMLYRLLKLWMKGTIAWERSWCICSCPETAKHTALRIWKRGRTAWRNGWRRITSPSPNREIHKRLFVVAGVLTIDPPYGPENCNSSNEITLSRVQDLIQGHLEASQWEAKNGCTDWNKISYFWKFFCCFR